VREGAWTWWAHTGGGNAPHSLRPCYCRLDAFKASAVVATPACCGGFAQEEYNKGAWEEIVGRCEEVGVDAFELNFSCPHGMPERRMGAAMGQDCELLAEVGAWVADCSNIPVWAKMTPNITDITAPARTTLQSGLEG
jgi:dihydropyrimidine dehydrogenase (NADP+)